MHNDNLEKKSGTERIEDIVQSPLEVKLNDGKVYKLGTIGFVDLGDFQQYIRSQKIALAENIKDKEIQFRMIEKAINDPIDLNKEYGTMNDVCYMTWKAIQKNHPEVTLSDMNKLVDLNNIEKVTLIMNNLGGKTKNFQKAKVNP